MEKGITEAKINIVQNIINQIGNTENQYFQYVKIQESNSTKR